MGGPKPRRWLAALKKPGLKEWAGPILIVILVFIYYRRLLAGEFPVTHDHPAHLFNAWLTSDVFLPQGRLSGWSDLWFAGYPANELYGPGGSLWVTFFRYITFGALDYGTTYGIAIFALFLLIPLSVYAMGRYFLGPLAGTVAALLMVVTKGSWYDLGWFWILEMGVWPFALGVALTFLSLVALKRYLDRGGAGALALSGLSLAAAVVGHPMSLLLLGIAVPLLLVHHILEKGRTGSTRALARTVGASVLGFLLCAAWLVPFVAKSAYSQKLGEVWDPLHKVFADTFQLDLFGPEWRLTLAVALCGMVIAIVRRKVWAIYFATAGLVMVLFANSTLLYELRLFDVASPLASIQYLRFKGVVRVFMYLLAGYALSELWVALLATRQRVKEAARSVRWRTRLAVLIPIFLVMPFVPGVYSYMRDNFAHSGASMRTQRDLVWWEDFQEAGRYLKKEMAGEPWSRVGAVGNPYDHVFSTLPVETELPVYTGGFVPAHTYRYFFDGMQDVATMRAVGVRYVLAMGDWGKKRKGVRLKKAFGKINVYEIEKASTRPASPMGDCDVQVTEYRDSQMVMKVSGVTKPCRIRIHRSDYPNWQASFDGTPLEIQRVSPHKKSRYTAFMSVVVPRDGTVTLAYVSKFSDKVGGWMSGIGWLVFVVLLLVTFVPRVRKWLQALLQRLPSLSPDQRLWAARATWATVGLLLVVSISGAVLRAQEKRYTFDRHVGEADRYIEYEGKKYPCRRARSGPGWQCSEPWDSIVPGLHSFIYDNRYCIYAHPSRVGVKHITFRDVPIGKRLSGFYGLLDSSRGKGPVHMEVRVGGNPPVRFTARDKGKAVSFEVHTERGVQSVDVSITAPYPEWRHFCFNMQVINE